jgi:uncharacterized protein (DUF2141 family)
MRIDCRVLSLCAIFAVSGSWHLSARVKSLQPLPANDAQGCTLRIHVDGLRNSTGVVGAAIFASREGWPEDMSKTVHHWPTPIPPGASEATAIIENLPVGDYGIVAIHDENKNHKLDRNFIGVPKEGFGFANNPHVGLSAPSFDAAIVHVTCPVTEINIHMIYK